MDPRMMAEKGERPPPEPHFGGFCPSLCPSALSVSKVLVHGWILGSVILGIVWIFASGDLVTSHECTGCDDADAGSAGCSCTVFNGLGGFTDVNGTYDASIALNPYHYFNWHPLLMTIGFVLCYMEGSLAYRVLPCAGTTCGAPTRKWVHGILQAVATACGIAGTVCIFKFHDATDGYTLYSLHSWIGLITVVLFTFQFVMGLWFFAIQKNGALRGFFIASHRWLGTVLGAFTATSVVTGILDEQRTMWDFGYFQGLPDTDPKAPAIVLSNWWCVLIAFAAGTTFYLLYDQTEKVKAVLKNEGVLQDDVKPQNPVPPMAADSLRSRLLPPGAAAGDGAPQPYKGSGAR